MAANPGEDKPVHGNIHCKISGVGESAGLFTQFDPPSLSLEAAEYNTWDAQGAPTPCLGSGRQVKTGAITVGRGLDDNNELYEWFKQVAEKGACSETKKELKVELLAADGKTLKTWNIQGAVITSYQHGGFDANGSGILTESINLECEKAELA